jgi:Protein of unknown function (DUF4197)
MRGALTLLLFSAPFCGAATPIALTDAEVARGLREALVQGADRAVLQLGRENGFLSNQTVRIPVPPSLRRADALLRKVGMRKYSDQLIVAMNRAAEQAVPEARVLLVEAVEQMSIADAKVILTGPEDAATQYFRRHTESALTARLQPIVQQATQRVRVTDAYSQYAGRAARFGLIKKEDAELNAYVTHKALEGLYVTIAEEERAIRRHPLQQTTDLLRRVFGSSAP